MREGVFIGLALVGVSAFHLIPAVLVGEIPARWPVKPLTRDGKPEQFWMTFSVFSAAGLVGLVTLFWQSWHYFYVPH